MAWTDPRLPAEITSAQARPRTPKPTMSSLVEGLVVTWDTPRGGGPVHPPDSRSERWFEQADPTDQ